MIRSFLSRSIAVSLALTSAGCAHAQTSPAAAAATVETSGPALWSVSDEDTTIYLFGTIHALPETTPWLVGDTAEALASAQSLVTELPPGAAQDPATQQLIMGMAMLPTDENLRAMLTDEQKVHYEAAMTKLGLPVAAFDRFDPWFAGMTLTMLPLLKSGYKVDSGVEQVIEAKAPAAAKRVGLETVESQMGVFEDLPAESQVAFLVTTAKGIDEVVPTLNAVIEAWKVGDAEKIAELMNAGLTDPVLADALLYARNRSWAEWIDERLDQPGTVFLAVGAGHLAGDKSVQDYLEDRGILVARVQ